MYIEVISMMTNSLGLKYYVLSLHRVYQSMTEKELSDRITRWLVINRLDDKQGLDEWTKLVNDIKGKGIVDAEGRTRYVIGDSKTNP